MRHYDYEALFSYVDHGSPVAGTIEEHLVECGTCTERVVEIRKVVVRVRARRVWEPRFDDDAFAERITAEKAAAKPLCDDILTGPPAWWPQRLRTTQGAKTTPVVQELVERVRRSVEIAPRDAEVMSSMAVSLAEELQESDYPPLYRTILLGMALRGHAYVLSFQGRHREALDVIGRAEVVLNGVAVAEFERALLKLVKACVLRNTGGEQEAVALTCEAAETFLELGDRPRYVNARITEGAVVYAIGAVRQALTIWKSVENDPGLNDVGAVRMAHNIGLCLADLGQVDVAVSYLYRCVVQFELLGLMTERTRSRGVLGRSLLLQNNLREAIPILRQTSQEFTQLGLPWDAGLASLELAEALLVSGQSDEVPEICRQVVAEFTRLGGAVHATTALGYLREAIRLGDEAPRLVRGARDSLRRLHSTQPRLFAPEPEGT